MLKLLLAVTATVLVAQQASAGWGIAGCGLGSMVVKKDEQWPQLGAAILNNLISPQTSAITSGTSGCKESMGKKVSMFISVNRDAFFADMSKGKGETLASFSKLIGCQNTDAIAPVLQKSFPSIVPSQDVSSEAVSNSIHQSLSEDKNVTAQCQMVG